MTTSNHRPFQFPSGRIDMASDTGRNAAVKYHDFAIGNFVREARNRPWFGQTLFVFCADHCASSAGKMDLDVTKFHIPAMIWNPTLLPPQNVKALCSQIDVMPTVLSLMNWSYDSLFFGRDVLDPSYRKADRRAFVSNYQKVALLREDSLCILKPKREVSLYQCNLKSGALTPDASLHQLSDDATAYYQCASWLFRSGGLRLHNPSDPNGAVAGRH
jgi:phosphoglycerol transferase MdoB-like AlkP superfamily enzyme